MLFNIQYSRLKMCSTLALNPIDLFDKNEIGKNQYPYSTYSIKKYPDHDNYTKQKSNNLTDKQIIIWMGKY